MDLSSFGIWQINKTQVSVDTTLGQYTKISSKFKSRSPTHDVCPKNKFFLDHNYLGQVLSHLKNQCHDNNSNSHLPMSSKFFPHFSKLKNCVIFPWLEKLIFSGCPGFPGGVGTLPDTNTHHAVFNIKALSITVNIGVESPGKKNGCHLFIVFRKKDLTWR